MFAMLKKLLSTPTRTCKAPRPRRSLRIESLEDRRLMAVLVQVAGTTLNITSDNLNAVQNETVFISDRGLDSGPGNITVTVPGGTPQTISSQIRTVNVNLGKGNDAVTYNMIGEMRADAARAINVNLGDGNDRYFMSLRTMMGAPNALGNGTLFQLNVNGGAGDDNVRVHAQTIVTIAGGNATANPWVVDDGARVAINLQGGTGNDVMRMEQGLDTFISGGLNPISIFGGNLALTMNGGDGNDSLTNALVTNVLKTIQRTGIYTVTMAGAAGNDLLQTVPSGLQQGTMGRWDGHGVVRMDGGTGNDMMKATVNANVGLSGVFEATMQGGDGADVMGLDYRGRMDGHHFLNMDGGAGNDVVSAVLNVARLSAGKVGIADLPATVRGGTGNDFVRFQAANNVTTVAFVARMLGDAGVDVGLHSPATVQARSTAENGDLETLFADDLES